MRHRRCVTEPCSVALNTDFLWSEPHWAGVRMNGTGLKWTQIVVTWALLALALALPTALSGVFNITGDDAMRLVGAIDLFNGQSWFDTTQWRDNAPYGASMHWSRLVDAPLVALMALATPFAQGDAPYWAAFIWPLLVLFGVVALVAELTERIAGIAARLPALALLAMTLATYSEFFPGRVDHHNVQIMLTLGMILATVNGRMSVGWASAAGVLAATGLAVGTEVLPSAVVVLICFALYWAFDPSRSWRTLLAVGISFPAALLLHMLAVLPVDAWLVPACDALSIPYVTAGLGFGLSVAVALVAGRVLEVVWARLLMLALLGAASAMLVLWLFPECRGGPYGNLDADVARILMPEIGEAQPVWTWLLANATRPQVALLLAPVVGTAAVLWVAVRAPARRRWQWLVLAGFCLALFVVFCLQVRGFRLLTIAMLPGPAWLVARRWAAFRAQQSLGSAMLAVLTILAFTGTAHWVLFTRAYAAFGPPQPMSRVAALGSCAQRSAYEPLAALPAGNLMSYLLIGPQLLLETPHAVVSAGYHRNEEGLRDMVRFFSGGEAEARAVVKERELDYLVYCNGISASGALAGIADFDGLSWPWLVPVSAADAPIQIYAIRP